MSEVKIVAEVNGKKISQQDVLKFLNDVGPQVAMQFQSPDGMQKVIEELVNQELLYFDALENNLEEEEQFKQMLKDTEETLLKGYALNKLIADETATEAELKEFFMEHRDHFNKPETAKASHILVDSEEKANEVKEEIDSGLSFEDAAKKYSTCPSKEKGGDLGEFPRGQMDPDFEEKAFSMEEDTISDPVKTQFGYHIIKLDKINPSQASSFEDVKEEVQNQVIRLKQQETYINKIEELKKIYEVKKHD